MRFRTPGTFLKKKILVGKKNSEIFRPPPPLKKKIYFLFVIQLYVHVYLKCSYANDYTLNILSYAPL